MSKRSRRKARTPRQAQEPTQLAQSAGDIPLGESRTCVPKSALQLTLTGEGASNFKLDPAGEASTGSRAAELADGKPGGGDDRKRSFSGDVYSGGVIPNHWWWGNLIIDLKGIKVERQEMPILLSHWAGDVVGWATKVSTKDKVSVEGLLTNVTDAGKKVMDLAEVGMPWQMSAGIPPTKIMRVREGESVVVNGVTMDGPGTVFEESILREASVVALGADQHTSVAMLSKDGGDADESHETISVSVSQLSNHGDPMDDDDKKPVESTGMSAEKAQQLATESADTARLEERERITKIDEMAAGSGADPKFVLEQQKAGKSVAEFAINLVGHLKEVKAKAKTDLAANSPAPTGVDDLDHVEESQFIEGQKGKTSSPATTPSALKAQFDASADLQEEFEDFETFQQWQEHEGSVRMLDKKEEMTHG